MNRFPRDGRAALLILAALALSVAGCSSDDPVTPNQTPVFTDEDAATQAGLIAAGMVLVLDDLAAKPLPAVQTVSGSSLVSGQYWMDHDPNHVWTDDDHNLTIQFQDFLPMQLAFDVTAYSGTANGAGSLKVATVTVGFTVTDVEVAANDMPVGGTLGITTGGHLATVIFTNGNATVAVGQRTWNIDLTDGSIAEI